MSTAQLQLNDGWGTRLLLLGLVLLFCSPMLVHPDGLVQGDSFRDEDWLHDISFSFFLKEGLTQHGEFPLRSHQVGGGYPVLGHPSDGTLSPFSLPFLVMPTGAAVRLNLVLLLWLGALGVWGLARRELGLGALPSLLATAAFIVSGWFPSMMLAGFYVQCFYLLIPLALHILLGPGDGLRRGLGAGLLLLPLLLQAGPALAATLHFLLVAVVLLGTRASPDPEGEAESSLRVELGSALGLLALLSAVSLTTPGLALGAAIAAAAALAAWRLGHPSFPLLVRLGLAVLVLGCVGAAKWVSILDVSQRGTDFFSVGWDKWKDYPWDGREEGLVGADSRRDGPGPDSPRDGPDSRWDGPGPDLFSGEPGPEEYPWGGYGDAERSFYASVGSFVGHLHFPLARTTRYIEPFAPEAEEYAPLGLTIPVVLVFVIVSLVARRRMLPWAVLFLLYLGVCFGPNLPGDPYRLLVWGLPGYEVVSDPYKYFNFFLVLPVTLGFGVAAELLMTRWGSRAAVVLGLLLLWPLAQNAPLFETLFNLPAPVHERTEQFHQRSLVPLKASMWLEHPENYREFYRPDTAREFFTIPSGVGLINWYADIYLPEHAVPRVLVSSGGALSGGPDWRGEAWCVDDGCRVEAVHFTPNTVTVDLFTPGPARLVINQNYDDAFVIEGGVRAERDGLLAVDLPPGQRSVVAIYRPTRVLAALAVSAVSLLVVLSLMGATWIRSRAGRATEA